MGSATAPPDGTPVRDGRPWHGSAPWPSRRPGRTSGSARIPAGHLQATGRDARGRKQYRYHERWRTGRDDAKFERLIDFARVLPRVRGACDADLATPGLPREKVLAAVVRLLETTLIRVGNDEYARLNRSFGLTTLKARHARVTGTAVRFRFRGKSGRQHEVGLRDRRLARVIRRCQDLPGQELFQYVDDDGEPHDVASDDVNAYLREISGADITAKDFRTWAGTVLAYRALRALAPGDDDRAIAAQRRRGRAPDLGSPGQHAGRGPPELRPPGDPRGIPGRLDRRRAARGGRGAARTALVARSGRGGAGRRAAPQASAIISHGNRKVRSRPKGASVARGG